MPGLQESGIKLSNPPPPPILPPRLGLSGTNIKGKNKLFDMKKILVKLKKRTLISISDIFSVKFTKQCTPNILAILLIFFKKESSNIVECYKSFFLKQNRCT